MIDINTPDEEIHKAIDDLLNHRVGAFDVDLTANYYTQLLLMKQQDKLNNKLLRTNRWLVFATWALVLATICVVLFK